MNGLRFVFNLNFLECFYVELCIAKLQKVIAERIDVLTL